MAFHFHIIDANKYIVPIDLRLLISSKNTSLLEILGYEKKRMLAGGISLPGNRVYLSTLQYTTEFGGGKNNDPRLTYTLHSNQAADLRGATVILIDIDRLNSNDITY
jgi:hypothetical protein